MATPRKRKQLRWKPGMVYAVPLNDGSFGIAQAGAEQGEFVNVVYVVIFKDRYENLPETLNELKRENVISLSATWKRDLNCGDWLSLEVKEELFQKSEFPNEKYAQNGYVGASNSDAKLLSKFVDAYHGILPWNVMFDPNYYNEYLLPELSVPETAVILSNEEREKYRRTILSE